MNTYTVVVPVCRRSPERLPRRRVEHWSHGQTPTPAPEHWQQHSRRSISWGRTHTLIQKTPKIQLPIHYNGNTRLRWILANHLLTNHCKPFKTNHTTPTLTSLQKFKRFKFQLQSLLRCYLIDVRRKLLRIVSARKRPAHVTRRVTHVRADREVAAFFVITQRTHDYWHNYKQRKPK